MSTAAERRKLARMVLDRELLVFDLEANHEAGILGNINISGMMLISNQPVEPEHIYRFNLLLPEEIGGKVSLLLRADCLWAGDGDERGQFIAGFQFVDLNEADRQRVERLIALYKR